MMPSGSERNSGSGSYNESTDPITWPRDDILITTDIYIEIQNEHGRRIDSSEGISTHGIAKGVEH